MSRRTQHSSSDELVVIFIAILPVPRLYHFFPLRALFENIKPIANAIYRLLHVRVKGRVMLYHEHLRSKEISVMADEEMQIRIFRSFDHELIIWNIVLFHGFATEALVRGRMTCMLCNVIGKSRNC